MKKLLAISISLLCFLPAIADDERATHGVAQIGPQTNGVAPTGPETQVGSNSQEVKAALPDPHKTKAAKVKEDLPNFHEVHPFLYRSGEPTEAGLKKLKEMGVKTLIDLRAPSERAFDEKEAAKELGLK